MFRVAIHNRNEVEYFPRNKNTLLFATTIKYSAHRAVHGPCLWALESFAFHVKSLRG